MVRCAVAIAVMLVYVGGSSWLEDKATEPDSPRSSIPGPVTGSPDGIDRLLALSQQPPNTPKKKGGAVAKKRGAILKKGGAAAKKAGAVSKKGGAAAKKAGAVSKKGGAAATSSPEAGPDAASFIAEEPAELPAAARDAVMKAWNTPLMTKVWDLANLSPNDEALLGEQLNALVVASSPAVEGGPMPRRLREAADPVANLGERKAGGYKFLVLDSESINAFSLPGGYVYVTKGLMDWVGEEQDHVLEFIVAHEIAHVDMRHAIKCLQDPGVERLQSATGEKYGTLQKFFLLVLPLGYLQAHDAEADRWAFDQMRRLGRTKRERLAFLRKLQSYAEANDFANGRGKPVKPGPNSSPAENHLRSHPAAYDRLKTLEKQAT